MEKQHNTFFNQTVEQVIATARSCVQIPGNAQPD